MLGHGEKAAIWKLRNQTSEKAKPTNILMAKAYNLQTHVEIYSVVKTNLSVGYCYEGPRKLMPIVMVHFHEFININELATF